MIAPEAMREMADSLDIYPNHPIDATSKEAAAMLRSIAAEREEEAEFARSFGRHVDETEVRV